MAAGLRLLPNRYFDSVFLMQVANRIGEQPGVHQAVAVMGTERNKELLRELGFDEPALAAAGPNDLVLGVLAQDAEALAILDHPEAWLERRSAVLSAASPRTLHEGLGRLPQANLAVISLPGAYAGGEARKALDAGLHVFLFSDNVPLETERELKELARARRRLLMGPDCGTAILGGIGIGFANRVRRGPIGAIGVAGTGLQEFTSLVHQAGSGISHALGTGGRDLSDAVGGVTTFMALEALEADPDTDVIVIIAKPAGPVTHRALVERARRCPKPIVGCLLGVETEVLPSGPGLIPARTIDEAAAESLNLLGLASDGGDAPDSRATQAAWVEQARSGLRPGQRYLRGLFTGGTFCYQAQQILAEAGMELRSNVPLRGVSLLAEGDRSIGHSLIDMGADEYTVGRPHPMIDSTLRRARLWEEARDPEVAALLLDVVLGDNTALDPAGELADAVHEACRTANEEGRALSVIASVCGTDWDPQDRQRQIQTLMAAGARVEASSAAAARLALELLQGADDGE